MKILEEVKAYKKELLFLSGLALVVRLLAYFFYFKNNPLIIAFDAGHYHALAQSLAEHGAFAWPDGAPYFYRLPGYPFFLSLFYFFSSCSPHVALLIQIFFSSFIPILIFLSARLFFPKSYGVAFFSGLLACVHVGYVTYSCLLMSETLFTVLFLSFLLFIFKFLDKKTFIYSDALLVGLMLGLASLVRPVGHFLLLLSFFMIFVFAKFKFIEKIKAACFLFLPWAFCVGFWMLRNFFYSGFFILHTLPGPHFINHGAIRLCMAQEQISHEQAKERVHDRANQALAQERYKIGRSLNEVENSQVMVWVAKEFITKDFLVTLIFGIKNMAKTVVSLYSSELLVIESGGVLPTYENDRSMVQLVQKFLFPKNITRAIQFFIYCEFLLFLFMLAGMLGFVVYSRYKFERLVLLVKLGLFAGLFIGLSAVCGFARLRLPIEHFLIMLAISFWLRDIKWRTCGRGWHE